MSAFSDLRPVFSFDPFFDQKKEEGGKIVPMRFLFLSFSPSFFSSRGSLMEYLPSPVYFLDV